MKNCIFVIALVKQMILPLKFDVFNGQKNLSAQELFYAQNLLFAKTFGSAPDCFEDHKYFQKLLLAKTIGSAPDCFKTIHNFKIAFGENIR